MKKIIFLIALFILNSVTAQKKIITGIGVVNFEASVPLFEQVKATNETTACFINTKTGEIHSTILIKDFHFKIALMEQHFNAYYLESERYPQATFKGRITGFNWYIIGNTPMEFKMKGKLELHGEKKEINTIVTFRKVNNSLEFISDFTVNTSDFNIKIPEVLSMKIAETVNIKTKFLLN